MERYTQFLQPEERRPWSQKIQKELIKLEREVWLSLTLCNLSRYSWLAIIKLS